MSWMDLVTGMFWTAVGTMVLFKQEWVVQNAIESGNAFCASLRIPQASESSRRIGGRIIVTFVGIGLIFFGLLQVYAFFTGQKLFE